MSLDTSLTTTTTTTQTQCNQSTIIPEIMVSLALPSGIIPALAVIVNSLALYRIIKYKVHKKSTTSTLVILVISDLSVALLELFIRYLFGAYAAESLEIICNQRWLLKIPISAINQIPMHCLVVHLGIRYQVLKKTTDQQILTHPSLEWKRVVAGTLFFCIILNTVSFAIALWLITGFDLIYSFAIMAVTLYLNTIMNNVMHQSRLTMSQSLRRRFTKQVVYGNVCLLISVLVFLFRNVFFALGVKLQWKLPLQVTAFIMNVPSLNNGLTYIIMDSTIRGFSVSCNCFNTNRVGVQQA